MEEIETVLNFAIPSGCRLRWRKWALKRASMKIQAVAKATCAEGETIHNMPFPVSAQSVHAAILTADLLGQQWLAR